MEKFIQKLIGKWQVIAYMTLVFAALAFFVSTLIPPKYRSDVKILILQGNTGSVLSFEGVNYLSDVFVEVAHTETFMADALKAPFEIEKEFSEDPEKRKNEWKKELKLSKNEDTGIIMASVFDVSKRDAEKIAGAVGWNFLENGKKYYGETQNVSVKIIDGPITTSVPAYPNVLLAALLGALGGFFASVVLIFFHSSFDLKVVSNKKSEKAMVEDQVKRQLLERKNKKQLFYEEPSADLYRVSALPKKRTAGQIQKIDEKLMTSVFAPLAEEKKFKEPEQVIPIDKEQKKAKSKETTVRQADPMPGMAKENFLLKLYKRSLFADKDFSSNEATLLKKDREKQQEIDASFSQSEIEPVEQVKKVVTQENKNEKQETDLNFWSPGGAKAPAPENLPIFLQQDQQIDQAPKEQEFAGKKEQAELESEKNQPDLASPLSPVEEKQDNNSEQEFLEKRLEGKTEEKKQQAETMEETIDDEREPNDDEIKERLNKLLKGEL